MVCALFVQTLLCAFVPAGAASDWAEHKDSLLHKFIEQDNILELQAALGFEGAKEGKHGSLLSEINNKGPGGQTPLMMATLGGKTEAVRVLLDTGADWKIGEKDGYTPCHGAGFQGRADIMELLLKKGLPCLADKHKDGFLPVHRACWGKEKRHTSTVKVLLKAGANLGIQELMGGKSCLDMTSNKGTQKAVKKWMKEKEEQEL